VGAPETALVTAPFSVWSRSRQQRVQRAGPSGYFRSGCRQPREPEPSTINEKTIADFTRVVEQPGILQPEAASSDPCPDAPQNAQRRLSGI
jgi:hypothetical protein